MVLPKGSQSLFRPDVLEKKIAFPAWHQTLAGFLKFSTFISDL